ncbi:MAG: pentapeptide repeat-containing protein [Gemmatimonadota bacterium]
MVHVATQEPNDVVQRVRAGELHGADLATALRQIPSPVGIDLRGARLDGADLTGLMLFRAQLDGASLQGANLTGVELSGASLVGAKLERAVLVKAGLGKANLSGVDAFEADFSRATLTGATLDGGRFQLANLSDTRVREASLNGADFRDADLRRAELSLSDVPGAIFDQADLRGARLRAVHGYERASWFGSDIRDINFAGAYRLRRHVLDENYLREFREAGPLQAAVYRLWWLTSDCGRSMGRWLANIAVLVLVFAGLFSIAGVDLGGHAPTASTWIYYSVVTLTSLGYGDILPTSSVAQWLVMIEVSVGYMMLGGLISILANKMSRRAE